MDTDFSNAWFASVDLSDAYLQGANLTRVILKDVLLHGAVFDDDTQWPEGFDPIAAGAEQVHYPDE